MQLGVTHKLLGTLLFTSKGKLLWTGWLVDPEQLSVPLPKLCQTVSTFFQQEGEGQNSSYLDAGNFAAASTSDGDYIVTIICTANAPETEVLLKAREVSHSLKLLLGACTAPVAEGSEQVSATADLFKLLQASVQSSTAGPAPSVPEHAITWLAQHGSNEDVAGFMLDKLQTLSPCTAAFRMLEQGPGFICAHFVDVTEPGEVLLSHWVKPSHVQERTSSGGFKLGKKLRSLGTGMLGGFKSQGTTKQARSSPSAIASIQQLMSRPISSLWTLVMREARSLALVASQSRRTVTLSGPNSTSDSTWHTCTIDLTALVPDAGASLALVQMQHYEAAFVIVYTVPGGPLAARRKAAKGKGKHTLAFEVVHGEEAMPAAVRPYMQDACADVKARFPVTRMELLQQIWPDIPGLPSSHGRLDQDHHKEHDSSQAVTDAVESGQNRKVTVSTAGGSSRSHSSHGSHNSGLQGNNQQPGARGRASQSFSRSQQSTSIGEQPSSYDAVSTAVAAAYSGSTVSPHQASNSPIKAPAPRTPSKHATSLGMCFMGMLEPSAQGSRACSIQPEPVTVGAQTRSGRHTPRASIDANDVATGHVSTTDHQAGSQNRGPGHSSGGRTAWAAAVESAQQQATGPLASLPTDKNHVQNSWQDTEDALSARPPLNGNTVTALKGIDQQSRQQPRVEHMTGLAELPQDLAKQAPDLYLSDDSLENSYKVGVYQARSRAAPAPQAPLQPPGAQAASLSDDKENSMQTASMQHGQVQQVSPAKHRGAITAYPTHGLTGPVLAPLQGLTNTCQQAAAPDANTRQAMVGSYTQQHPDAAVFADQQGTHCCPRPPNGPSQRPASPNVSRRHTHSALPAWDRTAGLTRSWQNPGLLDAYHSKDQGPRLTTAVLREHTDQDAARRQHQKRYHGHQADDWQGRSGGPNSPHNLTGPDTRGRQRDQAGQQRHRRRHARDPAPVSARRRLRELGSDSGSVRVPTATELLQGSLTREEERRWRLQLMYENISLRSALCPASPSGAACWPAVYHFPHPPCSPNTIDPPPVCMPPGYLGQPYSTGAYGVAAPPPSHPPPGYLPVYIPASPAPHSHHTTLEVRAPATQPPNVEAPMVHDALYLGTRQQPAPSPQVLLAPQGQPRTQPYCIWQLFNGCWYQLVSSGQWVPSAPPPTHPAAQVQADSAEHATSSPTRSAPCTHGAAHEHSSPAAGLAAASLAELQQGPVLQQVARGLAEQLWQQLQGLAVTSRQQPSVSQYHNIRTGHTPDTASVKAVTPVASPAHSKQAALQMPVSNTVGKVADGAQYFLGPEGQMYCCSDGQWFQVAAPQAARMPAN